MRCFFLIIALFALLTPVVLHAEEPFEDLPLDKALEKAAKENKVVMIDFYTTWCGPCKMLDRNTWPNADVKKLLKEKAVSLKVDAEKNRELSMKYRVNSYPQIVFLKPDGVEIDRITGYLDAAGFLRDAAGPLSGKDSITAKREYLAKNPKDTMTRLKLGDSLLQKGKPDEALKEYLWCFDFGAAEQPEFAGVRYTFLLNKIVQLARQYPPALKALEERRENAVKLLMTPLTNSEPVGSAKAAEARNAVRDAAVAVLMIDRTMPRPGKALMIYEELKAKGDACAEARKALAEQIVDVLWQAKRYDDIVKDAGDGTRQLDEGIARYTRTTTGSAGRDPRLIEFLRQQITNTIGKYYEALLATGKAEAAAALCDKLLTFDGSARAHTALMTHALNAGKPAAAREIAAKGMASSMSDADKATIDAAAKSIPAEAPPLRPQSPQVRTVHDRLYIVMGGMGKRPYACPCGNRLASLIREPF